MMTNQPKGYILAEIEITDAEVYPRYAQHVAPLVEKYGGRYLVRGGNPQAIEGERDLKRDALLEFPSIEQAKAFYYSPEYQAVAQYRWVAAKSALFLLQGA
jgi:uncharacterized protein (DUF1330 family)